MPRDCALPEPFRALAGRVNYVRRASNKEYSSSCPQCGGVPHQSGEAPDRFRMFVDDHPTAWCRRCNYLYFPDMAEGYERPNATRLEQWRKDQERRELERKCSAELALANLRHAETWRRYYDALDLTPGRAYWRKRGVPDAWQDYWALGWADNRWTFTLDDGSTVHISAATIPLFDAQWEVLNVKHRLIDPPAGNGKYRAEITGQPAQPFLCNPTAALTGPVLVVEGECKAMVCMVTLDQEGLPIIGLPGSTPAPHIIAMLKDAERVTLVLDPGAEKAAHDLATAIGRRKCRVLIPPMKIDDGILAARMGKAELSAMLRGARPA